MCLYDISIWKPIKWIRLMNSKNCENQLILLFSCCYGWHILLSTIHYFLIFDVAWSCFALVELWFVHNIHSIFSSKSSINYFKYPISNAKKRKNQTLCMHVLQFCTSIAIEICIFCCFVSFPLLLLLVLFIHLTTMWAIYSISVTHLEMFEIYF